MSIHQHLKQLNQLEDSVHNRPAKTQRLAVTERIRLLLDPESPWWPLSSLASQHEHLPNAGVITGLGEVNGQPCMIIANDPTVKAGTYQPITLKKQARALTIAYQQQLPCLYLVESGGAFLPRQAELFANEEGFGQLFYLQSKLSAAGIPQLAIVFGHCSAGGAYIPLLTDTLIMIKQQSQLFLAGPSLVESAIGEQVSAEDLGGTTVHSQYSGVCDYAAEDEYEALRYLRHCVNTLELTERHQQPYAGDEPNSSQLLELLNEPAGYQQDTWAIIQCLVDPDSLLRFKPDYGPTLHCCFASIQGHGVGILANQGVLHSPAALKATQFIQLCCQRNTPLLFLQDITGFMVGKAAEQGGLAKHGAQMVMAVANATVPKYTVIIGHSMGAGHYAMCGRSFHPDFLFNWPHSQTGIMGGPQATHILNTLGKKHPQLIEQFAEQATAWYASSHVWDDGVIHPLHTREYLGYLLSIRPKKAAKHPRTLGLWRT